MRFLLPSVAISLTGALHVALAAKTSTSTVHVNKTITSTDIVTFTNVKTVSHVTTLPSTTTIDVTKILLSTTALPVTAFNTIYKNVTELETLTEYITRIITSLSTSVVPYTTTNLDEVNRTITATFYTTIYLASTNFKTAIAFSTTTSSITKTATATTTSTITQSCCIPTPTANPSPQNPSTDNCGITGTWDPDNAYLNYYNTTASGVYGCAEICLNDQYCDAFAVSSISDPNAACFLWSATTAFNGFMESNNTSDMRYYDIDCFANAGCDLGAAPLCPGYVQGDIGYAPVATGYYDY